MLIDGRDFIEVDTVEKITIADSFVIPSNKLGTGNGEAKLYIGNDSLSLRNFYGARGFEAKCFFLKSDLIKFLNDLKSEYKNPQLPYQRKLDLPALFDRRLLALNGLPEIIYYTIREQTQIAGPRIYVNSNNFEYKLMRELALPNLCYLSIRKLSFVQDGSATLNETIFYTRLFVDYQDSFGETVHPADLFGEEQLLEADESLSEDERIQTYRARKGQGKYRQNLLTECPACPVTRVSDDRLLIASHIKPWAVSNQFEKTDPKNGFMFTPTIDYLFDKGFITFEDNKKLIISPWVSTVTTSRLSLRSAIVQYLPIDGREQYLAFHRENIFKQ